MRPHFKPVHTEELSDDDGETVFRSMVERSSIGWLTPSLIAASLTIATASAIGHYSFFQYLNNGQETSRIPQSWVTTVSTAIVKIFSICVGIALGSCYTQILWNKLRTTPAKISTIDALFSMQSNPIKLISLESFKMAPILWLLGLFCY